MIFLYDIFKHQSLTVDTDVSAQTSFCKVQLYSMGEMPDSFASASYISQSVKPQRQPQKF